MRPPHLAIVTASVATSVKGTGDNILGNFKADRCTTFSAASANPTLAHVKLRHRNRGFRDRTYRRCARVGIARTLAKKSTRDALARRRGWRERR